MGRLPAIAAVVRRAERPASRYDGVRHCASSTHPALRGALVPDCPAAGVDATSVPSPSVHAGGFLFVCAEHGMETPDFDGPINTATTLHRIADPALVRRSSTYHCPIELGHSLSANGL